MRLYRSGARARVFLTVLLTMATVGVSSAQVDLGRTIAFGDSLTHNDLLPALTGSPTALYGRDPMEAVFVKGTAGNSTLRNYAFAGSRARHLGLQVLVYQLARNRGAVPKGTFFSVEIGGNDLLGNMDLMARNAPGSNGQADSIVDRITRSIAFAYYWLAVTHRDARFVIWTVPDVSRTPEALREGYSAAQLENLRRHAERANVFIRSLDRYSDIAVFDVFALTRDLTINPPTVGGSPLIVPPTYGTLDSVFADERHPSAVANALIANAMIELLNSRFGAGLPGYSEAELAILAGRR